MNIERPNTAKEESSASSAEEEKTSEGSAQEISERERQDLDEARCREQFIREWITASGLSPEQKTFAVAHIENTPGWWRSYNGEDFTVDGDATQVEGNALRVTFVYFEDGYEVNRVEEKISLS